MIELDYMILAAHPDDAEIFCGGSVMAWKAMGKTVGIVDLTRGEAGTKGSVAERDAETETANAILNPDVRINLNLPDSKLTDSRREQIAVVQAIRTYRPKVLIAPWGPCRHPDHTAVHNLARSCWFYAGNGTFECDLPLFRPERIIYHLEVQDTVAPSFVVDVSDYFEDKMKALQAYSTQFYTPETGETGTYVGSKLFMDKMCARFAHYGSMIQTGYGEPFVTSDVMRVDDPATTFNGGE
jgi:bacillithiol biosynthesis deacetylase BshB1